MVLCSILFDCLYRYQHTLWSLFKLDRCAKEQNLALVSLQCWAMLFCSIIRMHGSCSVDVKEATSQSLILNIDFSFIHFACLL